MPVSFKSERLGRIVWIFFIGLILLNFHSCSPQNRLQGYIYYRLNADPTTLDPALIVDVQGGYISAKIFNGLIKLDENLNVVPDIAESWDVSQKVMNIFFI